MILFFAFTSNGNEKTCTKCSNGSNHANERYRLIFGDDGYIVW